MSTIDFAVWSPDAATFWASWVQAGIVTAPYQWTKEYPGIQISDQTSQGWQPTRKTGQLDEFGNPIMEPVPGWHANVRISGPLVWQFTKGLPQVDSDGKPLDLFARTWAAEVFGLTMQEADTTTGFPAGMRSLQGVVYTDPVKFKSATNAWVT